MDDWTGYEVVIAAFTAVIAVSAVGGVVVGLLTWYEKRRTKLYRLTARISVRSLVHARVELFDLLARLDDQDPSSFKSLLQRQVFHLDKALDDAEDFMPKDVLKIRDVRAGQRVRIDEVVDAGGSK